MLDSADPSHKTKKKKNKSQLSNKLTVVASEDGWNTVTRRSKTSSPSLAAKQASTATHSTASFTSPSTNPTDPLHTTINLQGALTETLTPCQLSHYYSLLSIHPDHPLASKNLKDAAEKIYPKPQQARCTEAELRQRFESVKEGWKRCGGRKRVREVMERVMSVGGDEGDGVEVDGAGSMPEADVNTDAVNRQEEAQKKEKASRARKIEKAICLGLGSPSSDASGWRCVVMWQLAVFLDLAQLFRPTVTLVPTDFPNVPLYAQDPAFNDIDLSFLASLDIAVLPTPRPSIYTFSTNTKADTTNQYGTPDATFPTFLNNSTTIATGLESEKSHPYPPPPPSPPPLSPSPPSCQASESAAYTENTLVYAPHFPVAYWTPEMRRGEVSVVIGNDVEMGLERIPTAATLSTLFSNLHQYLNREQHQLLLRHEEQQHRASTPSTSKTALPPPSPPSKNKPSLPPSPPPQPSPYPIPKVRSQETEMPDMTAHADLTQFLRSHSSAKWPEPEECVGAFNDMRVYWRGVERDA